MVECGNSKEPHKPAMAADQNDRSHRSGELLWWPDNKDRFAALLTDDEPPELAFYCSECAEREFGSE